MNNEMKIRLQAMEQQAQLKDGTFMAPHPHQKNHLLLYLLSGISIFCSIVGD